MRKSNDNIEEAFKNKMMEGSFAPPPSSWAKIEKQLPQSIPVNYWKWWAIAATILLFLLNGGMYYFFNQKVTALDRQLVSQKHYMQHLAFFQNKTKNKQKVQEKEFALLTQENQKQAKELANIHNATKDSQNELIKVRNDNNQLNQKLAKFERKIESQNQSITKQLLANKLLNKDKLSNQVDTIVLVQKDSIIIKELVKLPVDSLEEENDEKTSLKWAIYGGAHLMYKNIVANQIEQSNITDVKTSHLMKDRIGAIIGSKIYYPLNSKIDLVGGLGFSVLQEKYQLEETTISESVESTISDNQIQLRNVVTENKQYQTIHNTWTYLDVSLGLNYHLIPEKWMVYMGVGMQRLIPKLSDSFVDLTLYNSSYTIAIEKMYSLNQKYALGLSPYATFYLSNTYESNQSLNVKPYVVGFQCIFKRK